jgi:hypothetical protein
MEERKIDLVLRAVSLPEMKERSSGVSRERLPETIVRPYAGKIPQPGEIRLLAPSLLPEVDRPVYVAVLSRWDKESCLVAPFSRYATPATTGEWLIGREVHPLRVLSLWNARVVAHTHLAKGWIAAKLTAGELKNALSVFRHVATGVPLAKVLAKSIGLPILLPDDPRVVYQQEEATLMAPLATVPKAKPGLVESMVDKVRFTWVVVSDYCRKAAEIPSWLPEEELKVVNLASNRKMRTPVIQVAANGRRRVVARAESLVALPSKKACWRLSPAVPKLAKRRIAILTADSPEVMAVGVISSSGGRLDLDMLLKKTIPTSPLVMLMVK